MVQPLFSERQEGVAPAPAQKIEDRRTPELIFGVVGPIGSGATTTASLLERLLVEEYGYEVVYHRVRDLIGDSAPLVECTYDSSSAGEQRINLLQDIGNKLRKNFSPDYLARKCVERIARDRLNNNGYYKGANDVMVPLPLRRAHVIDSLKHPAELQLLRLVYGDVFWLVGVFAPEEIRRARLIHRGVARQSLDALILRDESEALEYGQKVRETFYSADFFVRNDGDNDLELKKVLLRYLDILLNIDVHTPNQHEAAMYTATSAAAKSACLSRQVGAAVYGNRGELLGVGWNDVPRAGGGLYADENESEDNRCYRWRDKICHNDHRKERLLEKILSALVEAQLLPKTTDYGKFKTALHQCGIRELLEFSRSIHAEMEALLSAARSGALGMVGSTLYTTTYPCHNCARHIVAAGVSKIYFIEPFPKSLALELHGDSISLNAKDLPSKVVFLQYEGVAPKNIIKLFKHGAERKRSGKLLLRQRKSATPVFQPMLDGFATYEQKIVEELELEESGVSR